jgi:hypothetical protein
MRARASEKVTLFVGPTLATARARELARPFRQRPPVKRLDVQRLIETDKTPGVLVVVDGLFHDTLAVGHIELREAIQRGWRVWGLSSMGAIRAREMESLGMRGFGCVYERFVGADDFQDDEVALLHEATPPYRALTEPLVHLRVAIEHLVRRGIVREVDAHDVVAGLKARWYGARTLRETVALLEKSAPGRAAEVRGELGDFGRFALKTIDLERFLAERPWSREPGSLPVS